MIEERRHSRYGLRGVRIGEASHPGPRLLRRYPGGFRRVHDVSSDEEPLIPSGRNVVPRLSGVDSTIPATPRALVQVGRELSPAVTEAETVFPPPTPEVSREQGDVFQTGVTVVDMSSNDTDQEEVGGGLRGNRFAALSEAGDGGQHSGHRGRFPARRSVGLGLTTRGGRFTQPRVGSRHGEHRGNVRCGSSRCCRTHSCP